MKKDVCPICGSKFEKTVSWKETCSKLCKHARWALKKIKEEKKIKFLLPVSKI